MKIKFDSLKQNKKEVTFFFLFFIVSILLCYFPYLWKGTYEGLDSGYHLARIESLADMLKSGIFPVKLHATLCYGYGYGTGFFYPNFFLYFPAILVALGVDLGVAAKIMFLITMAATFLSGYYCTWKLTNNVYGSVFAGAMILFSPLMVNSVYYVFALGHVIAMPFIPLSIVGLYLILEKDDHPWMFIVGFWGLLLTHSITMLMTFIVCALLSISYIFKIIKNFSIFKKLTISVLVTAGLTAAYWIPMLEQYRIQEYKVSQPWTAAVDNVPGINVFAAVQNGPGIIVTIALLFCVIYIIWGVIRKRVQKIDLVLTGFAVFLSLAAISQGFWNLFQRVLDFIQYPFRLFYLVTVLVFIEVGVIISRLKWKKWIIGIMLSLIVFLSIVYLIFSLDNVFSNSREFFTDRKITNEIAGIGSGQEWLPIDCSGSFFNESEKSFADDGSGADGSKEKRYTEYNVYVPLDKTYYDVPYIYYYGYQAKLTEENGTVTELEVGKSTESDGKLRVYLPEGKEGIGVLSVEYKMTFLQIISYIITGCVVIFLILNTFFRFRKNSYNS